jgi:two-component system cell cycle response regulator
VTRPRRSRPVHQPAVHQPAVHRPAVHPIAGGPPGAGSRPGGRRRVPPYAAGDLVPLSQRVGILMAVRLATVAAAAAVVLLGGHRPTGAEVELIGGFLVVQVVLGAAVVLIRHRPTALSLFGVVVMLDGVVAQYSAHRLGPRLASDLLLATLLATVCLVASYRNGIKLAVWQSLLIVLDERAVAAGLLPAPADTAPEHTAAQLLLLWLLVIVICVAGATSERELRRRRYDAEALQDFSAGLHQDDTPELVLGRLSAFLQDELDAGRVVLCTRRAGRPVRLLPPGGVAGTPANGGGSPGGAAGTRQECRLLDIAEASLRPALLLRLDPVRDPWLADQLPGARRLVALALTGPETEPVWAVFEHHGGRGSRIERRVVTAAGQAAAITRLALSRAELFRRTQTFAVTDALTGVANRRAFDERLTQLAGPDAAAGLALLLVDIDHFKSVNDVHGHQVGDQVLQAVALALAGTVPPGGVVARFGGEEFAVLLPGTDESGAYAAGEAAREAIAARSDPIPVTASVGVAAVPAGRADPQALVAAADAGLYRAKQTGRNRVCLPPAPVPRPVRLGG